VIQLERLSYEKSVSSVAGTLIFITGQTDQPVSFFLKDWASEGSLP